MPLLDYKNTETGEVREFLASPDLVERFEEGQKWIKVEVPTSFSFGGQHKPLTQKQEVKQACRSAELSSKGWKSRYSKRQMKKIWDL